jgi:hypothetical protein
MHNLVYPSQTKILEGLTKEESPPKRRFWKTEPTFPNAFPGEALFKVVSTLLGLLIVEKCFENAFGNVGSVFQNLRF